MGTYFAHGWLVETGSSEATSLPKDDGDTPSTDEGKPVVLMLKKIKVGIL